LARDGVCTTTCTFLLFTVAAVTLQRILRTTITALLLPPACFFRMYLGRGRRRCAFPWADAFLYAPPSVRLSLAVGASCAFIVVGNVFPLPFRRRAYTLCSVSLFTAPSLCCNSLYCISSGASRRFLLRRVCGERRGPSMVTYTLLPALACHLARAPRVSGGGGWRSEGFDSRLLCATRGTIAVRSDAHTW
jgi:hypothetical protein